LSIRNLTPATPTLSVTPAASVMEAETVLPAAGLIIAIAGGARRTRGPGSSVLYIEEKAFRITSAHEHPAVRSDMHPGKERQPNKIDDRIPGAILPYLLNIVNYDLTVSSEQTAGRHHY